MGCFFPCRCPRARAGLAGFPWHQSEEWKWEPDAMENINILWFILLPPPLPKGCTWPLPAQRSCTASFPGTLTSQFFKFLLASGKTLLLAL